MTQFPSLFSSLRRPALFLLLLAAAGLLSQLSYAQVPSRIAPSFTASEVAPLKSSLHPLARAEFDRGRASSVTKVPRMTLVFSPSATQKAALAQLLKDQQNPASPSYHQWLTPAQFGARFGMSDQDIATTEAWLEAQGFTILDVAHGRDAIHFAGTVGQVESAFHTEMHQYMVQGETHLANSTVLTMPAALAGAVAGIRGIAQFRPKPMHTAARRPSADALKPGYTAGANADHYLTPNDIATIYDINALYNAGFDGTGQSLAVVGQSAISTTDLDAFRAAAGLAAKEPMQMLVPNTGASTVYSGDEDESDIDLEWSGAIAKNATVYFVYVGSDNNVGVFDAMEYAIDNKVAPIISISYGECEAEASSEPATLEPYLMQANAQGQTLLASSGDAGATACDDGNTAATHGLSVSYPASSAYLTAMGGTAFNEGTGSYWNTANDSGGGSAISYIPETVWNETAVANAQTTPQGLTATGGGQSILFGKPSWQVAAGVPNDNARDVPDISLDAAVYHDGFLYCSGGSCTTGFASSTNTLTVAGGTSFDAPIFAGTLALINQKNGSSGAGNINADLYSLYGTANASVFHDITTGDNKQPCASGSIDCPAGTTETGFSATAGYDLASGLGSIDAYNLAQIFPTLTTAVGGSVTTLTASSSTPVTGTAVTFTASVTAAAGTVLPTGSVNFSVNGTTVNVALTNGAASYAATFTTAGPETITATYSGDANYSSSSSSITVTVASSTSTGSFTLSATNVSVTLGNSANSTLTIQSASGYSGVVGLAYTVTPAFTGCLFADTIGVGANGTVTGTVTVDTLASDCTNTGARHLLKRVNAIVAAGTHPAPRPGGRGAGYPMAAAAVLAGLGMLRRRRKAWPVAMVLMLAGLGTLSGCGGSSGTPVTPQPTSTVYTFTLTGTDSVHSTVSASTTFTATVTQ